MHCSSVGRVQHLPEAGRRPESWLASESGLVASARGLVTQGAARHDSKDKAIPASTTGCATRRLNDANALSPWAGQPASGVEA